MTEPQSPKPAMSAYEARRWAELNAHWNKERRQVLPPRAREALSVAGERADRAVRAGRERVSDATPEVVKDVGGFLIDATLAPTAVALLEWATDVIGELTDPEKVLEYHRKQGRDVRTLDDLKQLDLKELDEFTRQMALKWRSIGVVEGAAVGALATVPGPGTFASLTTDTILGHVLCSSIATRVAYAYGFDATDPDQKHLVERMVVRAYREQAPKVGTVRQAAKAYKAGKGRVRWSPKLREDERILVALEKLMNKFNGTSATPVGKVVNKMPGIAIVTAAGLNQQMLGDVVKQARHFAATQRLAEKYDLPLPDRLRRILSDPLNEPDPGDEDDEEKAP